METSQKVKVKCEILLEMFCYDVTNVVWRFLPERERVTLQTSCGTERVNFIGFCFLGI